MDNALLVVKTKANAAAEVDKVSAGEVRVGPVKGCEGERSKVMRGRGRGRGRGQGRDWEGRGLREVRRRRGAGEDTCKKGGRKLAQFFLHI